MKAPRTILVVVTLRIGDVLLATPLIRSLRLAWPDAAIDVLVFEQTEGVLSSNPDIRRVITVAKTPGFWKHLSLVASLFRRYDLAVTTLMSDRPILYAWIAGKSRIGMMDDSSNQRWKKYLLSRWAEFDGINTHTVLMNLKLADLLGIKSSHEVVVAWSTADENAVTNTLPFDIRSEAIAVLHMHPQFSYKKWREDGWVELAQWLKKKGVRTVLTGGNFPDELSYIGQVFCSMPSGTVNMAGKLNLAECAFLISRAKYYVGPDTAPTHMAAALGIPTIALFGPSNPVKWGPWPKGFAENRNPYRMNGSQRIGNVVLLQGSGYCVPCMHEGCDREIASLSDCLQDLPVRGVLDALQDMPCVDASPKATGITETTYRPPKKIAIVVPKYGLVGGGERFASEVTERLARDKSLDIHVFANHWVADSKRIRFHKIPMIHFPRFVGPWVFAWFVERKIGRMNFDLVHSHHWIFHADIFSAHGVPHAGWVRNVRKKAPSLYDRTLIAVEQRAMRSGSATCFLPVSSIAMEAFRREYTTLPGKWQIVHPGVEVTRFSLPDRNACRTEIRGCYGIGADDLLVLFVGMNFEVKGLDTIIASVAKARAIQPEANIRLLVVGRGDKKKYGKIAGSLGVAEAVIFAGTQYAGLERFYRAADIFTLFSVFDTFGMVVLEAMAAGLPAIVSPNVGAKDLVQEGINGFILPAPHDVDAAADHIAMLTNKEQRDAMGAAAMQAASTHDWERLSEKMAHLYQETLSEKSNRIDMGSIA